MHCHVQREFWGWACLPFHWFYADVMLAHYSTAIPDLQHCKC